MPWTPPFSKALYFYPPLYIPQRNTYNNPVKILFVSIVQKLCLVVFGFYGCNFGRLTKLKSI